MIGVTVQKVRKKLLPPPQSPSSPDEMHNAASLTPPHSCYWLPRDSKKSTFTFQSEEAEVDVRDRDIQRQTERKRTRGLTLRDSCSDNSMQFGTTRTATTSESGFMGTWQNADTNLLFRMSQQVRRLPFDCHMWKGYFCCCCCCCCRRWLVHTFVSFKNLHFILFIICIFMFLSFQCSAV